MLAIRLVVLIVLMVSVSAFLGATALRASPRSRNSFVMTAAPVTLQVQYCGDGKGDGAPVDEYLTFSYR